jgi:NCS1 family nucleobase:cation symporter-1
VLGTLVGVALLGAAAVVGADTGVSSMAGLRPVLGLWGAGAPAVLNALQLVGWGAFELVAMGTAANGLVRHSFGFSSLALWTALFGLLATALAMMGPVSFVRRMLRRYGIWLLVGGAGWLSWRLATHPGLFALFSGRGTGALGFAQAVDLVIAMPISWLPLVADYTRFGKAPKAMFRGSTLGYLIANIWFYTLGAGYALLHQDGDLLLSTLAASGGALAVILVIIDETDNAFADVFSAASSTATFVPLEVFHLSMIFGVLCTGIAIFAPLGAFEGFLYLISSIFAPLFAVQFVDHFILRKRAPATTTPPRVRLTAILAWALGIATYQLVSRLAPAVGATLPAMAVAAASYLVMSSRARRPA